VVGGPCIVDIADILDTLIGATCSGVQHTAGVAFRTHGPRTIVDMLAK
jgi:hypothetical protein